MNPEIKKPKKVAIVGFAPSYVETPWNDEDFEIWSLNEGYKLFETIKDARVDRWFEIHNLERPPKNKPEHIAFLEKLIIPFYTLKKWDFIKNENQIAFPFDKICEWLKERGHIGYKYFTNSISWFIALAIMEGFEEIHIYGVDMAVQDDKDGNSEYSYQKPSCEYMLGVAEKYAKVYIPETSDLLKAPLRYAIDQDNDRYVYVKKQIDVWNNQNKQINQQIAQLQNQLKQLETQYVGNQGAVNGYRLILKKRV